MDQQQFDIPRLIALRKLTTALSEHFARQVSEYLRHLAPLLNPKAVFGDLIRGEKASVKGADAAFQELYKLYQAVAPQSPFQVSSELKPPLDVFGVTPEITPASYAYTPGGGRTITVRSPLKWVVSYKDQGPHRLREQIVNHKRSGGLELQSALLHYLVLHLIGSKPAGLGPIFGALRFPMSSAVSDEFGKLPLTYISSPISTMRPPDDIIIMNTEISGTDTFDEVVNPKDIADLSDPLSDQVMGVVEEFGGPLMAEIKPKS